jgi:SAM-dependent methyltransferase
VTFGGDCCIGFFDEAWAAGVVPLADGARVLEIGSAEYDFLSDLARVRPDLDLVGIDWRISSSPKAIKGDVLTYDFPPESFDAVISISTLEHIGLGGYDGDPLDPDGDSHAIQRAWTWLKPGGWLYFDVPYRPEGPYGVHGNFRAYDPEAFAARFAVPHAIERDRRVFEAQLGDAPYLAVVWEKSR